MAQLPVVWSEDSPIGQGDAKEQSGGFATLAAIRRASSLPVRRRPDEMAMTKLSAGPHLVQSLSVADCCSQIRDAVR